MSSRENTGMALGLLGVVIFSLTLPFTRVVVQELHPLLNGLGRALFAAVPAALLLLWRREKWPTWKQFKGLTLVIAGVILGFPVLSAWAMQTLPASHGALVNGLQPLCVALYAAWLSHERPSKAFWACAALGSALVLGYALISGAGSIQAGDLLMLGAIGLGGLGYAEGGRLAREMGGWQVICWVRRAGDGRDCPGQPDPAAADLLHHRVFSAVFWRACRADHLAVCGRGHRHRDARSQDRGETSWGSEPAREDGLTVNDNVG